jgi:CRISPR-associated protein Csb2
MLALEVEYLMSRVFAGTYRDRSEPEWPPHPSRLYTALAASYFESGGNENERRALEWLERQGPPLIRAGRAGEPTRTVAFVPTNYPGDGPPVLRGKQPRVFAAQGPSEAKVHFVWHSAEADDETKAALDGLAVRTGYLGKAASLIRMCLTDAPPEPNWIPDPAGDQALRVVRPGRLAELEWLFGADQRPTPGPQHKYRCTDGYQPRIEAVESVFGEMLIFRKIGGVGLPIEATLTLTDAVRNAILSNAGGGGPMPDIINGHGEAPHIAIAALPFVGTQHADGHLMGFAVIVPRNAGAEERRAVRAACAPLQHKGVHLSKVIGDWRVEVDLDPLAQTLRPHQWTHPSLKWASVTPILLDRFPKKGAGVEDILRASCARIGLPEPTSIEHSPFSNIRGVAPVPQFRLIRKPEERARWGVHATLVFQTPVKGPVLLGAGRFFGMGLMKPVESGDD